MADTENTEGAARLKQYVERIERLEEEKAGLTADIREVFSEAKGSGFNTRVMKQIIRLRKKSSEDRREEQELMEMYMHAMGMD